MKKQMKTILTIIIMASLLLIGINTSYAAETTNFSVTLTTTNTNVKQGEKVDVIVKIGGFTNIGEGVNSFMAELVYDETKLTIDSNSIVAQNGWDTPTYESGKILTLKGSMVTSEEAIIKMTFTVKDNAALGETTISLNNPEAANTENDFVGKAGETKLTITKVEEQNSGDKDPSTPEPSNPQPSDPEPTNPQPSNPQTSDTSTNQPNTNNSDAKETIAKEPLPKTGYTYGIIVVAIIAIAVIGIIAYKKYKNAI